MMRRFASVSLQSALLLAASFTLSESILVAQAPPSGQQDGGNGGGGGGGGGGRRGNGGGGGGGQRGNQDGGNGGGGQRGGGGGGGGQRGNQDGGNGGGGGGGAPGAGGPGGGGMPNLGRMFGGGGGGAGGRGMGGMRGLQDFREVIEADYIRRDIPIFVRQLSLTEDQSGVLETLFVDYETTFQPEADALMGAMTEIGRTMMQSFASPERQQQMRATWDKIQQEVRDAEAANGPMDETQRREFFRERMRKATEEFAQQAETSGLDAEVKAAMGEMLTKVEAWQVRKAQLRDSFTQGLKAVLDDDQLSQWPAFERFLIREKTLPRGRISGENLNLFFVVDELRMPQDEFAKIEPMFNDYETRLDSTLRARNAYIEESMPKIMKAMKDSDSGDATRVFKRQSELRAAVRDVNEEFRKMMVAALGESAWAQTLDKAILEGGWERFFRATNTDRMFDEAVKIEGLDPGVVQSIKDLHSSYKAELLPMNNRLKDLARTQEPEQLVTDGERFVGMMSQGIAGMARNFGGGGFTQDRADDPMRKVFDERTALGERYEARLKDLLTPEQYEKLPRSRGRGNGGPGGMGGPGGNFDPQALLDRLPEEQRKQFMDAVDKNKNGKIDEDERDGIREYMRQQFNNRGGGQGGNGGPGGGNGGNGGNGGRGQGGRGGNGGRGNNEV